MTDVLGFGAVQTGWYIPAFRTSMPFPSSALNTRRFQCFENHSVSIFSPEDGDIIFLRNIGISFRARLIHP
jgi:hypothetical protein